MPSPRRETHRLLDAPSSSAAENGNGAGYSNSVALAPQYVEFKEAVRNEMSTIKQKMNELKSLHGRAALTTFDDSNSHEVEIDVVTQEITRLFRKCEARLQQFGAGKARSDTDEKVQPHTTPSPYVCGGREGDAWVHFICALSQIFLLGL